jgi:hypothetical protein
LLVDGVQQNDEEHGLAVVAKHIYDLLEVARGGRDTPRASRPVKHSADDHKGTPPAGDDGRYAATPLGGGENVYPFDGPAPEDTRLRPPTRRLTLPEVTPQTRPGRTG